ncbi:integrase catalytic domain-containing protein [Trichonephila clavipes]|nr:integrase catalytic domain-containing protein [Trichonephila clavipes]
MENNICNSMILTSRRRHFYLVRQSKHKVGACGVNNQASAVLAGNELPFVAFLSLSLSLSPDGRGYELVSSVRALVPQKFSVEEELMHVKHVDVKSPHVGVMWKFGRGVISSAIETKLGWTVIGKVCSNDKNVMLTTSSLHVRNVSVKELWELDVLGITDPLLNENTKENFELTDFKNKMKILPGGRYEVKLPWKCNSENLPSNKELTWKRHLRMMNRLRNGVFDAPKDKDYLSQIFFPCNDKQLVYRHCRVVFGVSSSPYLLNASIMHLLENSNSECKEVAQKLKSSFYVDNCVTGVFSADEIDIFIEKTKLIMSEGCFNLRIFESNVASKSVDKHSGEIFILGIIWDLDNDVLKCCTNFDSLTCEVKITKQLVLSTVQKVFDPIERLAPSTLLPKLLLQEIWKMEKAWDQELPQNIVNKFIKWFNEIQILKDVTVPRLTCDCEFLINSRPLTYISENPQELIPLTPAIFLIENRCSDTTDIDELNSRDLRKRMKYRIKLLSDLRQRFRKEYLSELIQKQNDNRVREPRIGEIVLIGNDNKKRLPWPIAKIIELIPGRDGEIRTVRLKTQHGTVIRPVQRIFPLEVQAIANSDKELKEESISVKSIKPEKVLNTNDAIVKKIYFFWKIG